MNVQRMKAMALVLGIAIVATGTLGGVSYALRAGVASSAEKTSSQSSASSGDRGAWPPGVTEEFALNTWQEQLESQAVMTRLVEGHVDDMRVDNIRKTSDEATVEVTVGFTDSTSANGFIELAQRDGNWYVTRMCGERTSAGGEAEALKPLEHPESQALPQEGEVDIAALKAMLWEQSENQDYIREILDGEYDTIDVVEAQRGAGTTTVKTRGTGKEGSEEGDLVLVNEPSADGDAWFVISLTKK